MIDRDLTESDSDYLDDAGPLCISCDSRSDARTSWIVSAICAGFTGYGAYRMSRGPLDWTRDGPILAMFLVVFPAIALLMALHSAWETLRCRTHDQSTLEIPRPCGRIDEPLVGTIRLAHALELAGPAKLTLERLETRRTRHGGEPRTHTRRTWSATHEVTPTGAGSPSRTFGAPTLSADAGGAVFPVHFNIPVEALAPGDASTAGDRIYWTLTLTAPTRGPNFVARFNVPAYAIQDTNADDNGDEAEDGPADALDDDHGSDSRL